MADNFGLKIGVEGEKEFKNALRDINQSFKVLGSEMNLVASQFDKNDKSMQALTARNTVLNKEIEAQKNKIELLQAAMQNATDSFGENDRRTQNWQIQLNKAQAELNGMERELEQSTIDADKLGEELDDSGKSADEASGRFEKLGDVLKGIGITMGAVAVAAGAAAIKLGQEVVQQFGELEQNLGGSEAVFGEYAASIQKTGEEAYKNLGVSQSEYLATANKMGALFQGSGIEQQKSLELTEKAMQRAADMASVMGIDMQMALDSVAGAAKGNFTMMDNLGVAMNATNIQAYALAKGLDFTWASATNAEKAEVAMQMFFDTTEQYAGNFAKESTQTITGSIGLLQAALGSFTAGLGNANADMTNLTQNLVDAFQAVVTNIVPVLENIVAALPAAVGSILQAVGDLLPLLLQTVTELFSKVLEAILNLLPELIPAAVNAVMTIAGALIDNLPLLIEAAVQLVSALVEGIGQALPELIPAAVNAVATIVQGLTDNLPMLLDAALQLILGLAQGLLDAIPQLIAALPAIINALVDFTIGAVPQIIQAGIQLLAALVKGLPEIIIAVVAAIPQIVEALVAAVIDPETTQMIIEAGFVLFVSLIQNLPAIIAAIVKAVPQIITAIVNAFRQGIDRIVEVGKFIVEGIWEGVSQMGGWLADKVRNFARSIIDSITSTLGISSPSAVMRDLVGKNLVLGLAEGISQNSQDAVIAAHRLVSDTLAAIEELSKGTDFTVAVHSLKSGLEGMMPPAAFPSDFASSSFGNRSSDTPGSAVINNTLNFYTPTASPADIAKASRRAAEQMLRYAT